MLRTFTIMKKSYIIPSVEQTPLMAAYNLLDASATPGGDASGDIGISNIPADTSQGAL